jgi:hypothetical protein
MKAKPIDRDRLAKVLALLASPIDGECLAAARKVVQLLATSGMRPEELAAGLIAPNKIGIIDLSEFIRGWEEAQESYEPEQPRDPFAAEPTPRRTKPRQASVRDLGPAALRRMLDDLLIGQPFPLLPKHQSFVRTIKDRLYREPHIGLRTDEVRRLNMLWRAWQDMQSRTAA